MGKASSQLSIDRNRCGVGTFAGSKPSDINNSKSNRIAGTYDEDHDGKADYGVSRELSEDENARWAGKVGGPGRI